MEKLLMRCGQSQPFVEMMIASAALGGPGTPDKFFKYGACGHLDEEEG